MYKDATETLNDADSSSLEYEIHEDMLDLITRELGRRGIEY